MNTNNKLTLVVLAAGMGSRYGGLKQMDTFTPEGDTILDFSIYDALRAGFGNFIFIIRKSFEEQFRNAFDKKLKNKATVNYVFQELDRIPEKYINPKRVKPWGTGHALLTSKDHIKENFAVINADDFYGKEAFETMAKELMKRDENSYDFLSMAYLLKNTLSEHGYVSRGECKVDDYGYLLNVIERTHIEKLEDKLIYKDEYGKFIPIDKNTIVSMNFWGFTPKCFEFIGKLFEQFLEENQYNLKSEFYLPSIVNEILKSGKANVKVLKSKEKWFGVTYKKDKTIVKKAIEQLKEKQVYPKNLF